MVCDFFYSARDSLTSRRLILQLLLLQILSQMPSVFDHIVDIYRNEVIRDEETDSEPWSDKSLSTALLKLNSNLYAYQVILVTLDDLDESEESSDDRDNVSQSRDLSFFGNLAAHFKSAISSRHDPGIARVLQQSSKIILELENLPDVVHAVEKGINDLWRTVSSEHTIPEARETAGPGELTVI